MAIGSMLKLSQIHALKRNWELCFLLSMEFRDSIADVWWYFTDTWLLSVLAAWISCVGLKRQMGLALDVSDCLRAFIIGAINYIHRHQTDS